MRFYLLGIAFVLVLLALPNTYAATEDLTNAREVQPYIESLKDKYGIKPKITEAPSQPQAEPQPKIEKPPLDLNPQELQPYIEHLRSGQELPPPESKLPTDDPSRVQPYIQSVKAGRELKPEITKKVESAAGLSIVASNKFNITSTKVQANPFDDVYNPEGDGKYNMGFDLFYERQLFRSRTYGSIGPVFHATIITAKGKGIFTRTGIQSQDTNFHFYAMPISLGASYRLVQTRFVVPFVQIAAMGVPVIETRDDGKPSRKGISSGVNTVAGVALNLDWISRKNAWDQYDYYGVLHTYLVAQLEYIRSIKGPVSFNYNGLYIGLMFEF